MSQSPGNKVCLLFSCLLFGKPRIPPTNEAAFSCHVHAHQHHHGACTSTCTLTLMSTADPTEPALHYTVVKWWTEGAGRQGKSRAGPQIPEYSHQIIHPSTKSSIHPCSKSSIHPTSNNHPSIKHPSIHPSILQCPLLPPCVSPGLSRSQ